jgi:hypothetical protein
MKPMLGVCIRLVSVCVCVCVSDGVNQECAWGWQCAPWGSVGRGNESWPEDVCSVQHTHTLGNTGDHEHKLKIRTILSLLVYQECKGQLHPSLDCSGTVWKCVWSEGSPQVSTKGKVFNRKQLPLLLGKPADSRSIGVTDRQTAEEIQQLPTLNQHTTC